jgi:phosphoribosyl 1,2-cyclic phosphodiesterase
MHVRFFGTRGSIATPGPSTLRYGGNTSCVEVRSSSGTLVVLDMGTGAAVLGRELMERGGPLCGHVLISHTHWDHIQGIPFFAPFSIPGGVWDIYAPRGFGQTLRETLAGQMQSTYFPVALEQLGATIRYHELVEGRLSVEDIEVTSRYLNHPALTLGYRLQADGVAVVYACDHEPHSHAAATGLGDISAATPNSSLTLTWSCTTHNTSRANTGKRWAGATAPSNTRWQLRELREWNSSRSPTTTRYAMTQRSTTSFPRCVRKVRIPQTFMYSRPPKDMW